MYIYMLLLLQGYICEDTTDGAPDSLFAFTLPTKHILGSEVNYIINPHPWENVSADFEYYMNITLSINSTLISEKIVTIRPNSDETGIFVKQDFQVNSLANSDISTANMAVTARLADGTQIGDSMAMEFHNENLRVARLIFDKKFYVKGDLVQFMYMLTNVALAEKYIEISSLRYDVTSPSNTKIIVKELSDTSKLLHTDKFHLDEYAEVGEWTVSVNAETAIGSTIRSFAFSVIDYVQPTFKVQIYTQKNYILGKLTDGIPFKINAVDSFDQLVKGSATISFHTNCSYKYYDYYDYYDYDYYEDDCSIFPTIDVSNFNGAYSDTISSARVTHCARNCGHLTITIRVNVTNSQTGLMEVDEAEIHYVDELYKIRSGNCNNYYDGRPYYLILQIETKYSPVVQEIAGTVVFEFEANERTSQKYNLTVKPEDDGLLKILLPIEFQNEVTIMTKLIFYDNDGESKLVYEYRHLNSKYDKDLQLSVEDESIQIDTDVDVTIVGSYNSSTVNFVTIAFDRIVYYKNVKIIENESITITVPITNEYRSRVYFRVFDLQVNGTIEDSISFDMPLVFAEPLTVSTTDSEPAIGENIELDFQTSGTSQVLVIAHDYPENRLSIELPLYYKHALGIPEHGVADYRQNYMLVYRHNLQEPNNNWDYWSWVSSHFQKKKPAYVPNKMPLHLQKTLIFETVDTNANGFGELNSAVMPDSICPLNVETIVLTEKFAGIGNKITLSEACAPTHERECPMDSPVFSLLCNPDLTIQIDINHGCLAKYYPRTYVTDLRLMPSGPGPKPADQCAPCSTECSTDDNFFQNQALTEPVTNNSLEIFFKATTCGAVMEVESGTNITSFKSQIGTNFNIIDGIMFEPEMEAVNFSCNYATIINNVSPVYGTIVMESPNAVGFTTSEENGAVTNDMVKVDVQAIKTENMVILGTKVTVTFESVANLTEGYHVYDIVAYNELETKQLALVQTGCPVDKLNDVLRQIYPKLSGKVFTFYQFAFNDATSNFALEFKLKCSLKFGPVPACDNRKRRGTQDNKQLWKKSIDYRVMSTPGYVKMGDYALASHSKIEASAGAAVTFAACLAIIFAL